MSYINEALRKAQRERDNCYEQFGGIIADSPGGAGRLRKRRVALFAAAALILLVSTVLLLTVRELYQPPPTKKAPQFPVAGTAAPPATAPQPEPTAPSSTAAQPSGGTQTAREVDVRYGEALLAQRKGDLKEAETLYQRVLTLDPDHVRALNTLGVIYMAQKKRGKAIEVLGRALVLKKDYVDPYYNLACLYAQGNEINESLWYLKVAAIIDGDVLNWAKKDADMKTVAATPEFKKLMEGQKN
jgi:tetratricopeptide (TPR) repeat protein